MTLTELGNILDERSLSMNVWPQRNGTFVVWLFAADDPALGICCGEGEALEPALREALQTWDGFKEDEDSEKTETDEPKN